MLCLKTAGKLPYLQGVQSYCTLGCYHNRPTLRPLRPTSSGTATTVKVPARCEQLERCEQAQWAVWAYSYKTPWYTMVHPTLCNALWPCGGNYVRGTKLTHAPGPVQHIALLLKHGGRHTVWWRAAVSLCICEVVIYDACCAAAKAVLWAPVKAPRAAVVISRPLACAV